MRLDPADRRSLSVAGFGFAFGTRALAFTGPPRAARMRALQERDTCLICISTETDLGGVLLQPTADGYQ
jgi:hypothetical protein